jgi:hypothetical protein
VVVLRTTLDMTDVIAVRMRRATEVEEVGRLRNVTQGSVVLDPRRQTIYFTRHQANAYSLHALSFAAGSRGQERLVYQGEPHGRAFSGTRVLRNGQLLFSFQTQRRDILSNQFPK